MKKICVTGGAGFIGSHLVENLLGQGHEVYVVDNFEDCYADNLAQELLDNTKLTLVERDLAQPCEDWIQPGTDEIYHLAGLASAADFVARPIEAFWVSVYPTDAMLRYKVHHPNTRLLFTSSSEVYGDAEVYPQFETYRGNVNFTGVRGGYDEGKRAAETLISSYWRTKAVACATIRISNTYGPRMRANGRVIPTMLEDAIVNRTISVSRPGTQSRTFLFVTDLVDALLRAMERQVPGPINVGGTHEVTLVELAEYIKALFLDVNISIEMMAETQDDVRRRKLDTTRARELLEWEPRVPFEQGMSLTREYILSRLNLNGQAEGVSA